MVIMIIMMMMMIQSLHYGGIESQHFCHKWSLEQIIETKRHILRIL